MIYCTNLYKILGGIFFDHKLQSSCEIKNHEKKIVILSIERSKTVILILNKISSIGADVNSAWNDAETTWDDVNSDLRENM